MKKILMIVVVLALVGGGVFGGMMLGRKQGGQPEVSNIDPTLESEIVSDATSQGGGHGEKQDEPKSTGHGSESTDNGEASTAEEPGSLFYEMASILTNLRDPKGKKIVKATIQLEASSEESLKEIDANMVPIRDATIFLLSDKEQEEIATVAGKERLKREMIERFNAFLDPRTIQNIYFTELVFLAR